MPNTYAKTAQQLTVPQHFYRPKNSRVWYVRLVPPRRLQQDFREPEFRKSTGHADLKRARPIGASLIADKLREWDAMERSVPEQVCVPCILNANLIKTICDARMYSWMRSDDEDRAIGFSLEQLAEIETFCTNTDRVMRAALAQGPASNAWGPVVEEVLDWCSVLGHGVDTKDPQFLQLVRAFAKAERDAQKHVSLRNAGDDAPTPDAPRGHVLSEVTEPFRAHKSINGDPKYVGTLINVWGLFIKHGGDIGLDAITHAHIFSFFESRLHATKKPWSSERAKGVGRRALSEIFGLARVKGLMTIDNPMDGFKTFPNLSKKDEASREKPRYPFKSEQLNALFASTWYDPSNDAHFRGKMRTDLGARYWIPLFSLFHGNRAGEALQLVASDFSTEGEVLVVAFRTELGASAKETGDNSTEVQSLHHGKNSPRRRLKTKATARTIPVHPSLTGLGFGQFIENRRSAGGEHALIFPSSAPEPNGGAPKFGRSYEQAFLRYVRDRLKFGAGYGNHSFRHQLEDRIRAAQATTGVWPAGLGQHYAGRKTTREVDKSVMLDQGSEKDYGDGYTTAAMLRHIQQMDFSDVLLPPPFEAWLGQGSYPARCLS